jgi:hypothetical protein
MEVNGQFHALADLPQGKNPESIGQEAGWASEPILILWQRKKSCTAGIEPQLSSLYRSHYTDLAIELF